MLINVYKTLVKFLVLLEQLCVVLAKVCWAGIGVLCLVTKQRHHKQVSRHSISQTKCTRHCMHSVVLSAPAAGLGRAALLQVLQPAYCQYYHVHSNAAMASFAWYACSQLEAQQQQHFVAGSSSNDVSWTAQDVAACSRAADFSHHSAASFKVLHHSLLHV